MTHPNRKFIKNIPGKYYVDDCCIGCALCVVLAPSHFRENLDLETTADSAHVWRQPLTVAETSVCREAMRHCPVDAIGEDGLI